MRANSIFLLRVIMSNGFDVFALLERTDKWFLGSGSTAQYAPPFPKWLDTPGFWDETYCADIRLDRLYCLLFLDSNAKPLTLRRATKRWTPDCLTQIYTIEGVPGVRVQEERVVTENDTFATRITLTNTTPNPLALHVLLWSLQDQQTLTSNTNSSTIADIVHESDLYHFAHRIQYGTEGDTPADVHGWGERDVENSSGHEAHDVFVALGASRMPDSWTVNLAETTDTSPLWSISVVPEKFRNGVLSQENTADAGWNPDGLVHLLLHYSFETPANSAETITFGASVGFDREKVVAALRSDVTQNVATNSRRHWHKFFESVPYFECDDPYIERAYWYRWYCLHLNTVRTATGRLRKPCVFEGIAGFRSHVSYSAQCHARELSWQSDGELTQGCIENFFDNIAVEGDEAGSIAGHLYTLRPQRGFYHADWGRAALQIYNMTGDLDFVQRIFPKLAAYAEYFERERDCEKSGLFDVVDQGETGQEYLSRYLFADPDADGWKRIQLKGIDATCYLFSLFATLSHFAGLLNNNRDAFKWGRAANDTAQAINGQMWDAKAQLYKDVIAAEKAQSLSDFLNELFGTDDTDAADEWRKSPFKAAVGFYPFLYPIADDSHLEAWSHLDNPSTFGTPFPIPASSVDDPFFDPHGDWKGKRTNCAWNGRVWAMTTSHVIDALAQTARTLEPNFRPKVADLLRRYIKMQFHDGDPKRPNSYEHYNPFTGMPSLARGIDDYLHGTLIDLIMRHLIGIQPEPTSDGNLVIDPIVMGLKHFRVEGVALRGHKLDVAYSMADGFTVKVDGRGVVHERDLQRVEITL